MAESRTITIVLVHGAFAESLSNWKPVVELLLAKGYEVVAAPNPLRGVSSDAAYISSILNTIDGPIILVGHSYGGAVITNAANGNQSVKALVYVAAFAPDTGESVATLLRRFPGSTVEAMRLMATVPTEDPARQWGQIELFRSMGLGYFSDLLLAVGVVGGCRAMQVERAVDHQRDAVRRRHRGIVDGDVRHPELLLHSVQVPAQLGADDGRERRDPILVAFAGADDDLMPPEIDVFVVDIDFRAAGQDATSRFLCSAPPGKSVFLTPR